LDLTSFSLASFILLNHRFSCFARLIMSVNVIHPNLFFYFLLISSNFNYFRHFLDQFTFINSRAFKVIFTSFNQFFVR